MIDVAVKGELPVIDPKGLIGLMDEVMRTIIDPSVHQNFTSGGRPNKWTPLKKTGKPSHLGGAEGSIAATLRYFVAQQGESIVGTERAGEGISYAAIHQHGGIINHPG